MGYEETYRAALERFAMKRPEAMARAKGGLYNPGNGTLSLPYLGAVQHVHHPSGDMTTERHPPGGALSPEERVLLIQYLSWTGRDTSPASEWLAFNQLEGGESHWALVQHEAADPLGERFGHNIPGLYDALKPFKAREMGLGDASFIIEAYPKVYLGVVLWRGDEEFPPRASLLIDEAAPAHLTMASLFMLGLEVSRRLRT